MPRSATAGRVVVRTLQLAVAAFAASGTFLVWWWRLRAAPDARPRATGRALVAACTRLGATFIKVGQIASTRADLLPAGLVNELASLRDRVPAFPFAAVRATIERDFGHPLETLFAEFATTPVAAASVAQVHEAIVRTSGERVAVKVRRPDIVDRVALDRAILLAVGRGLERLVPTVRLLSLEGALRAFCDAVTAQIDLGNEARNNRRFAANFADDADVHFPRLVPALCSDAVLTMEFVDGVDEAGLDAAGIDRRRVVDAGMRCICRMIFLHGFVHADLHPGNLRFLPPGRLVLLDLGLVGRLEDDERRRYAQLIWALSTGDGVTVARLFHRNAPQASTRDYEAYERDVVAFVDHVRRQGLARLQITGEIARMFAILRRHGIQARSHVTMINVALMTAEGLGKRLAPELSLTDAALPYLAEALGLPAPTPP